jgi:CheY-like chemotaxis protein
LLEAAGHRPLVASDGPAGLGAIEQHAPDVVLLDLGLPGIDGYEVARRATQARRPDQKPPFVVALTGHASDDARRRSADAGADLHLVKPADPDALLGLLARFSGVIADCPPA